MASLWCLEKSKISLVAGLNSHRLTYVCGRAAGDVPGGQMIFHNVDSPRFLRCCGVSAPSSGLIVETDWPREEWDAKKSEKLELEKLEKSMGAKVQ
jgi:hypothetical protein